MKTSLFISTTLFAMLLGGCASAGSSAESSRLRLQVQDAALRQAALRVLHRAGFRVENADPALPLLQLGEADDSKIESLLADGSAGSYELNYTLTYQFGGEQARQITRVQVVDYDENFYRASRRQQQSMVESLRRSALAQMIASLKMR